MKNQVTPMNDLPSQMTYVDVEKPPLIPLSKAGPKVLKLVQGPLPETPEGHVLIKVHAAGVNYPDLLQRKGEYNPPPGASPILGLEVSGEIVALGKGASKWNLGDKVCALANGGGYAQYVAVPEGQCLPIPNGVSLTEAACLPEVYFTVWYNVFRRGLLKKGEAFLVHGGSGGIGSTAIQLAKAFGAKIYTTCGSEEHCQFATDLGADVVINYKNEDFTDAILKESNGQGVDVILDYLAGDYFDKNLSLLKKDGRLIEIAALKGRLVQLDILQLTSKRLTLMGSRLRPMTTSEKAAIADDLYEKVWPLFKKGLLRSVVTKVFPFKDVIKAHEFMEESHMGKIVLEV